MNIVGDRVTDEGGLKNDSCSTCSQVFLHASCVCVHVYMCVCVCIGLQCIVAQLSYYLNCSHVGKLQLPQFWQFCWVLCVSTIGMGDFHNLYNDYCQVYNHNYRYYCHILTNTWLVVLWVEPMNYELLTKETSMLTFFSSNCNKAYRLCAQLCKKSFCEDADPRSFYKDTFCLLLLECFATDPARSLPIFSVPSSEAFKQKWSQTGTLVYSFPTVNTHGSHLQNSKDAMWLQ